MIKSDLVGLFAAFIIFCILMIIGESINEPSCEEKLSNCVRICSEDCKENICDEGYLACISAE
jgi:hypothetical protein